MRLPHFAPGAVVTAVLPDGRRLVQELHAGSSYLSSETHAPTSGSAGPRRWSELTFSYPGGRRTRLNGVAANQVWRSGGRGGDLSRPRPEGLDIPIA